VDELEEEMLSKIPKFKARPLNKKNIRGSTLAAIAKDCPTITRVSGSVWAPNIFYTFYLFIFILT
jgi:hypothetical protein